MRGTLDLLLLKALSLEPVHGQAIAQRLDRFSREPLRVGQGSLYPALQRHEEKGRMDSGWRCTHQNRRARYVELTPRAAAHRAWSRSCGPRHIETNYLILRTTGREAFPWDG